MDHRDSATLLTDPPADGDDAGEAAARSAAMSTGSAVRLEDVAARVGVSRSEVSRVLNGRVREGKGVGPATRERILQTARDMNYRPHRAAQNLARGRTDTVALMMVMNSQQGGGSDAADAGADADISPLAHASLLGATAGPGAGELSPHYHEIIGGLTYTLNQYGLHLLLAQCGDGGGDPVEAMEQIARSRTCDGMIITDMQVGDRRPAVLEAAGLPYVIRGSAPHAGAVAVGMDNVAVGREAVRYLHGLGHRRILFFNLRRDLMAGARRYEGARRAAEALGIAGEIEFIEGVHGGDAVCDLVTARLRQAHPPTAVFAEDEIAALGAERAILAAGLRLPEDVSLLSCLNARFMRLVAPHLTMLDVRQSEVASQAAHRMARLLRGEPVPREQSFVQPVLQERGSTGPARG